jgi:hypothetical protein
MYREPNADALSDHQPLLDIHAIVDNVSNSVFDQNPSSPSLSFATAISSTGSPLDELSDSGISTEDTEDEVELFSQNDRQFDGGTSRDAIDDEDMIDAIHSRQPSTPLTLPYPAASLMSNSNPLTFESARRPSRSASIHDQSTSRRHSEIAIDESGSRINVEEVEGRNQSTSSINSPAIDSSGPALPFESVASGRMSNLSRYQHSAAPSRGLRSVFSSLTNSPVSSKHSSPKLSASSSSTATTRPVSTSSLPPPLSQSLTIADIGLAVHALVNLSQEWRRCVGRCWMTTFLSVERMDYISFLFRFQEDLIWRLLSTVDGRRVKQDNRSR